MLKIKQENLIKQDNRYYYDNERFNGVIFFIKNFIIEAKKVCKDGQVVGDYINPYFDNIFTLHIDKDALEIPNPKIYRNEIPRYYKREPFTGIVYKFQNGFCIEETEYRDGIGADNIGYDGGKSYSGLCSINYFETGIMKEFKRKDNNLLQEFDWYENNNVKNIYIDEENSVWFGFSFTDNGQLIRLDLDWYFEEFDEIKKKIEFNILPNKKELLGISLANKISFSGEDIKDELLKDFFEKSNLKDVNEIFFSDTSLTQKGYKILLDIPSLEKVHLRGYNLSFDVVDRLREKGVEVKITTI